MSGSGREGRLRGLGKQVPSPRGRRRPSAWASTITRRQASSLSSSCDVAFSRRRTSGLLELTASAPRFSGRRLGRGPTRAALLGLQLQTADGGTSRPP